MTAVASGSAVRERPLIVSGPMVRAILDGRKTQTRRVVKPQPTPPPNEVRWNGPAEAFIPWCRTFGNGWYRSGPAILCPYGAVGDRLWVRETFQHFFKGEDSSACLFLADAGTHRWRQAASEADATASWPGWKPSIHMPRWASRITLEITGVRVERVQDITSADAWAEGVRPDGVAERAGDGTADVRDPEAAVLDAFRALWDALNARRGFGWDVNPWVWVLEFRRVES